MNIRARLKNAAIWGTALGTAGAVVGGGLSTLVYYAVNYPSDIWNAAIEKGCNKYGCSYQPPGIGTIAWPDCYMPYQYHTPGQPYPYRPCEYPQQHNACLEQEIRAEASKVFDPVYEDHRKNTIEFLYKFAAPIGFGAGALVGGIIGFCKTPANTVRNAELAEPFLSPLVRTIPAPERDIEVVVVDAEHKKTPPTSPLANGLFRESFTAASQQTGSPTSEKAVVRYKSIHKP